MGLLMLGVAAAPHPQSVGACTISRAIGLREMINGLVLIIARACVCIVRECGRAGRGSGSQGTVKGTTTTAEHGDCIKTSHYNGMGTGWRFYWARPAAGG